MTNFLNQTPHGGSAQVDDWQTPSSGSDVHDSPPLSQPSIANTSFFFANTLRALVLRAPTILWLLFYGLKMTNFLNQTPHGGSSQVNNWQTPSGGSDVHDSPPSSQTSINNNSFFSAARNLTLEVNNVHEDKYTNVLVMGGHIISTTVVVLATNCKYEMSSRVDDRQTPSGDSDTHDSLPSNQTSTDNTSFFYMVRNLTLGINNVHEDKYANVLVMGVNYTRSHTRVLSFIFDLVGSLFYGMKMTNFRNQTPNGGSAQVDDRQTLSGGSDIHDSPPPSQTSTDNTSFFSAARSLTCTVNNVHEDKYANVLVMEGHIISTTTAVLATNCKSEIVVGVMRATTIIAMGFSLVIATGLHMPNEVVLWSLLTNSRNQTPNGGSAKVDDQQTLSGDSDVHDSPPPSQTSTDNSSFFSAARSLTLAVNNVHEDKYANVLVMGGHIISTIAASLTTNCKSEMYKRVVGVMRAKKIVAMDFSLVIATRLHMSNEVIV
ncbi:hypothetical protein Patl1_27002 [Pistacia atlantica]|uniref:Uncharacterized protein n=1 Tax=Pistacia atlantica TaxID=434234 RepID=A0ACC1B0E0_9ROSI|nr:hypothetical protein Patl1_27002 [Pistacia atlantica]